MSCLLLSLFIMLIFHTRSFTASLALDIDTSIQLGLQYNKDMRYFGEELKIQILGLREQKRSFFPQVSIQFGDNDSVSLDNSDSRSKSLTVSLSQLLFDGGQLRQKLDDAQIQVLLARLENSRKRLDFIESIMNAYLSILQQEARYELRVELFQKQKEELTLTRRKFQLGEATVLDYYEWEIQTRQSEMELMELSNSIRFEKISYNRLIGIEIDRPIHLTLRVNDEIGGEAPQMQEKEVLKNTLLNSIDLKKIQLAMKQARITAVQKRQFVPSVSVNASYSTSLWRILRPEDQWNIGFQFSIPLFSDQVSLNTGLGGNFQGSQKSFNKGLSTTLYQDPSYTRQFLTENISLDKLKYEYNDLIRNTTVQVRKLLSDLEIQNRKIFILQQTIQLSEAKMILLRKQLDLGEIKTSDYIAFQNSLNSKKIDLLDARFQQLKLMIQARKLQGLLDGGDMKDIYQSFFIKKDEP